jgi:superoxide dismutase, Cu-Zn family
MRRSTLALAVAVVATAGIATAATTVGAKPDRGGRATALLVDASGARVGSVELRRAGDDATRVRAVVDGVASGFHGFHVHAVGRCEPPFASAGGHHVGEGGAHREHDGDLPPLLVLRDGSAVLETVTDRFTVDELLAGDGSAFVVHAGPDNLANVPDRYTSSASGRPGPDEATLATGDAGARAACGVVRRPGR